MGLLNEIGIILKLNRSTFVEEGWQITVRLFGKTLKKKKISGLSSKGLV